MTDNSAFNDGIGVYIHIPFCSKRCSYCNFYSACSQEKTVSEYLDALISQIENQGGKFCRPVDSVYIGGGTPSLLGERISEVLDSVRENFKVSEDAEITVEMNPEKDTGAFLNAAYKSGANRLSVGMQSTNEDELLLLGRRHTNEEVIRAVSKARETGFNNISVDIMTGLPFSNIKKLENTLSFTESLKVQHISAYILKIEPKTVLYAKNYPPVDDDQTAEQYLFVCDYLKSLGFSHYEISNFAKPGFYGRHNMKYWQGKEYIGIGPSAHSFIGGKRFYYKPDIRGFINCPETVADGEGGGIEEYVMLSLRIKSGLSFERLYTVYGVKTNDSVFEFINMLCRRNLATFENGILSLTDRGMLVSNSIITEILERLI